MLSPEEVDTLYKRIEVHRFHLSTFLHQKTMFGDAHVPPVVLLGIRENRSSIQHLKNILRGEGLEVNDQANDFETVAQATPTKTPAPILLSEEELENLWQQAEQAFKEQDWEKAEPLLIQVASASPRYREVQRLIARTKKNLGLLAEYRRLCALEDNQWREAESSFTRIRQENPGFIDKQHLLDWITEQEWCENQFELAEEYVGYGDTVQARQILTGILDIRPDNRRAHELMEIVVDLEAEEKSRQRQAELTKRQLQARHFQEQEQRRETVRKDVELIIGVIVVLVILIVIISRVLQ
jgi:tetratricopeptide (TPR) repeat protein